MGNPYFKTTKGYNGEVIVAKSGVAYSDAADLAAFVANGLEGQVAVVLADTNKIAPGTAKLEVGTKVFIAQKRDGAIHRSSYFVVGSENGKLTPYKAPVKQEYKLTVEATSKHLEIAIIETTVGNRSIDHAWSFDQPVKTTVADALTALAAKISNQNSPENYAFGVIAECTATATELVIKSVNGDRTFDVALRQGFTDKVLVTAGDSGVGTPEQVRSTEKEGHIYDGVTTNYIDGMINPSEMGEASSFVSGGKTYDTLLLNPTLTEKSPLPFHEHKHYLYIYVALPSGEAVSTAIQTVFGYSAVDTDADGKNDETGEDITP